jgi:hypothetical protein
MTGMVTTADIQRAWTEKLYQEYDNVLFHYRLRLKPPVIRVAELTGSHGLWSAMTRTLTISSLTIVKYPWDVVIEVLKHEMAHQVVSEVFGGGPFHDQDFKRACAMLGVAEWAASATGALPLEIPQWKHRALSEEEEKLLKRVEKLLSLAESSNEHEAALAMQRVQHLYAKYNLERIESRRQTSHVYAIINRKTRRIEAAESMIFSILADHFFVRVIYSSLYDAQDLCDYKVAELMGTPENVAMAEYVFHFLWNKVQAFWKEYSKRTGKGASARRSYMLGVISGFRDKLRQAYQAGVTGATAESRALIKAADRDLEEFVSYRHPKLQSRRWGGGRGDQGSFNAGVRDGGTITIHRGLTHRSGNRGLLLR